MPSMTLRRRRRVAVDRRLAAKVIGRSAELDLLAMSGGRRLGFEMKLCESPRTTKSMHVSIQDLRLDHLYVVHPGEIRFALDDAITALPAREIPTLSGALV